MEFLQAAPSPEVDAIPFCIYYEQMFFRPGQRIHPAKPDSPVMALFAFCNGRIVWMEIMIAALVSFRINYTCIGQD